MAQYTCPICNKTFERRGKRKPRTCSFKCYAESMRGKPNLFLKGRKFPERCGKNNPFYGKKPSPETIEKSRQAHLGIKLSEEHKRKIGLAQKGSKHWNWKKGRTINTKGYVLIYSPYHPFKDSRNCVREHRLVAEAILKRYLTSKEVIHHIDGNKRNNKPDNLYLFKNDVLHLKYHREVKKDPSIKITKSNL